MQSVKCLSTGHLHANGMLSPAARSEKSNTDNAIYTAFACVKRETYNLWFIVLFACEVFKLKLSLGPYKFTGNT